MLKYLYPHIDWETVTLVGFDLDGTLYDEAEFVAQCYRSISRRLSNDGYGEREDLFSRMFCRWLEKGSSYGKIFREVISPEDLSASSHLENNCVELFRNFQPKIVLSERVRFLLDYISNSYHIFLVTDGSKKLQSEKIKQLGLGRWFKNENIAISGSYGPGYQKPNLDILKKIKALQGTPSGCVVYFGDRDVDSKFAAAAGFYYVQVSSMVPALVG